MIVGLRLFQHAIPNFANQKPYFTSRRSYDKFISTPLKRLNSSRMIHSLAAC